MTVSAGLPSAELSCARPVLDVVVPVHNEQAGLETGVRRLHAYLKRVLPFTFRITCRPTWRRCCH